MNQPPKTIDIHGTAYVPVHERVRLAHEANKQLSITTEWLPIEGRVVCKATVTTEKGTFTGTSAADPNKQIEKASPYEVAESSAIGRALGFAGYGIAEGIASADEMTKATTQPVVSSPAPHTPSEEDKPWKAWQDQATSNDTDTKICPKCQAEGKDEPLYVKTSGPTSKNPGRDYWGCDNKHFVAWVDALPNPDQATLEVA